eukprot:4002775-Prymnesium_polylepis.1
MARQHKAAEGSGGRQWRRRQCGGRRHTFDALGSTSQLPASCGLVSYPELVQGSKKGDDDKRLCSSMLHELRPHDVIVSLGSNNEFGFEEQMLACSGSHIATFDCTVKNATNKPLTSRVSFHPYCIGPADTERALTWKNISEVALQAARLHSGGDMDKNRPPRIAVLKADVEGWEWVVLDQVLSAAAAPSTLPQQIAVEVHLITHERYQIPGFKKTGSTAALPNRTSKLQQLREKAGFALIDRNDNPWCRHCSELLFLRV